MRLSSLPKPTFTFKTISNGSFAAFVICYLVGFLSPLFLTSQIISIVSFSRKLPIVENAFKNLINANEQYSADRLLFTSTLFLVVAVISAILAVFCGVYSQKKVPPFNQRIEFFWGLLFTNVVLVALIVFPNATDNSIDLIFIIDRTDAGYLLLGLGFQSSLLLFFVFGNVMRKFAIVR